MFAKTIMHYHPQAIACIYAQETPIQNRCNDVWGQTVFLCCHGGNDPLQVISCTSGGWLSCRGTRPQSGESSPDSIRIVWSLKCYRLAWVPSVVVLLRRTRSKQAFNGQINRIVRRLLPKDVEYIWQGGHNHCTGNDNTSAIIFMNYHKHLQMTLEPVHVCKWEVSCVCTFVEPDV